MPARAPRGVNSLADARHALKVDARIALLKVLLELGRELGRGPIVGSGVVPGAAWIE